MKKKLEPGMAYDTKALNRIFALLSVALLFVVIWVFLDDYIRPWKVVQIEAQQIRRQKLARELERAERALDGQSLEAVSRQLEEGRRRAEANGAQIGGIRGEIDEVDLQIKAETIANGQLNSRVSALAFEFGVAHSKGRPGARGLENRLRKAKGLFRASKDRMKALQARRKVLDKKLLGLRKDFLAAKKKMKALRGRRELLLKAKAQTDISPVFVLRNAPFVDFLDPTLKIRQVVLKNITDDRYFQHVPKVDRCMTCHTFIDQKGYEDQANPHKTHPNLDVYVGAKSHHPLKDYGCTSCHKGEGHRVHDFNSAAHIPDGDEQTRAWVGKHNYHPPHKVSQPMLKKKYTESSCLGCHRGVEHVPMAGKLNKGLRLMEQYGCYGCHKVEGFEHKRKAGPGLRKVASKVTKEFFKNWVWDPKSFNRHAAMPRFFGQSNNSEKGFMLKNIAEVNAMAEVVWERSEPHVPLAKYGGGSRERGRELIKTIGCMGCHQVEGIGSGAEVRAGPYLTGTGSKVDADWLVSWLKRPAHYQEDTIMPSFRLSDREANDIAAYLLGLRNSNFEKLAFAPLDGKVRDEILLTYFSSFATRKAAARRLARMGEREKTLELGRRSIGKYACNACHDIQGFEKGTPIGPELTKVGSKPLSQFGFGHEHDVEHSRDGWIKAHLLDPRRWDRGSDRPFKDLSRMPNFGMTEKEAELITLVLLGHVGDHIPAEGVKNMNEHEKIAARGMRVINKYNCTGCHSIDGDFGDIRALYEDDINEAPPPLNGQGHRVQSDWLYRFLGDVTPIRPWLKVRMPSFNLSSEEKNQIVAMFQHKSRMPTFVETKVEWLPGEKRAARRLFEALDCASCHTQGFNDEKPPGARPPFDRGAFAAGLG